MTYKQSEKLKVDDRVAWHGDLSDQGTVIERGYHAVKIQWDNGQLGTVAHEDATCIELVTR